MSSLPIGLALSGQGPATALELARQADATGASRLLISEQPGGMDSLALAASVLGQTQDLHIKVGPGLVSCLDRHPLLLARSAATLDQIAPGRAFLCLGRTSRGYVEGQLGLPYQPATARIGEAVSVLRRLLAGEEVEHRGGLIQARHLRLHPAPKHPLPVLLGASGIRTISLGAGQADGCLLNGGSTMEFVRWARAVSLRAAPRSGPDPQLWLWCLASVRSGDQWHPSLERICRQLAGNLIEPDSGISLIEHSGLSSSDQLRLRQARQDGIEALSRQLQDQRLLSQLTVLGTRDQVHEQLRSLQEAGADLLVLQETAWRALAQP